MFQDTWGGSWVGTWGSSWGYDSGGQPIDVYAPDYITFARRRGRR